MIVTLCPFSDLQITIDRSFFKLIFDAKSLFTNIPVNFTINLIIDQLFPDSSSRVFSMNKQQFRKLLNWTCNHTTFQFKGKFYKQLDGMAMGFPLAPAMADIFMNWFIDKAQPQSNCSFSVLRYVDDLFLSFDHHKDIDEVFKIFNSTHNNIAFTKELEENNALPFLDTLIHQTDKNINTSVYRKPTHIGLYTQWNSYVPIQFKQNLIKTLSNRSHNICNTHIRR